MQVALFDLYTSGHHLPYASRIKRALETVSDHQVTFLTLSGADDCSEFFDTEDVSFLDGPDAPAIEDREGRFVDIAETQIERFCSGTTISQYDVVHFLYVDDILGPLRRHTSSADACLVGELNGVFFHRGTVLRRPYVHPAFLSLLGSPGGRLVDLAVPDRTSHEALWKDLLLYRCLDRGTFDRFIVHSREAGDYLSRLSAGDPGTVVEIPYPAPTRFGEELSRADARERLGLGTDGPVLLFFGSMKREKGVHFLLEAVRRYRGPPFTLLLAGPPVAVDEEGIEAINRQSPVEIVHDFGFVSEPEPYFRAADGVVLPYQRQYGGERASQLFEEACSALRPVIVPDPGVLGRLTRRWGLGETYEQGSTRSLADVLARFARGELSFSTETMRQYSETHSYEQAARRMCDIYENGCSSATVTDDA